MTLEEVRDKYNEPAMKLLGHIAEAIREDELYSSDPCQMFDDTYRWSILAHPGSVADVSDLDPNDVDITIEVCDSKNCDGTLGGVNFSLSIVTAGGRVLGGITPYNYTDRVWVELRDPDAVQERWDELATHLDAFEVAFLVSQHFEAVGRRAT